MDSLGTSMMFMSTGTPAQRERKGKSFNQVGVEKSARRGHMPRVTVTKRVTRSPLQPTMPAVPAAPNFAVIEQEVTKLSQSALNISRELSRIPPFVNQINVDGIINQIVDRLSGHLNQMKDELRGEINASEGRLRREMEEMKREMTTRIDGVEGRLTTRIDRVETRLNQVEERLTTRIDQVDTRLNQVEENLTTRIDRLYVFLLSCARVGDDT